MNYNEWQVIREKFMNFLDKKPDSVWKPENKKIKEVVISNDYSGSVMNIVFQSSYNENKSHIPYELFLELNGINENDFLN